MAPKSGSKAPAKKVRRKEKKNVAHGHAHIKSTFNNTIVSITDPTGAVIAWASAGQVGFKGSRKSTPFAAQLAAEAAARRAMEHGMRKVDVFVKGPGSGRETAIRSLQATGLEVGSISDVSPVPQNPKTPKPQNPCQLQRENNKGIKKYKMTDSQSSTTMNNTLLPEIPGSKTLSKSALHTVS